MTNPYKTIVTAEAREVELTYHEPMFPFDAERVRGIKIIAFDNEGRILGVKKGRTYDIPSGCQEWEDDTFEETAYREANEQAQVTLGQITLAAVIEEALKGSEEATTYTLVMTGMVKEMEPMLSEKEHKRAFLTKSNFLKRYRFGNPEALRVLIEMTEFAVVNKRSTRINRKHLKSH